MPSTGPMGHSLASSFIPMHSVTYDRPRSVGKRDRRTSNPHSPLPSHEAVGWPPRAVSKPAHPSEQGELSKGRLARWPCRAAPDSLPGCRQPGVPGQPEAAAPLAVTALRPPTTAPSRCRAAPRSPFTGTGPPGRREARPAPPRRHGR